MEEKNAEIKHMSQLIDQLQRNESRVNIQDTIVSNISNAINTTSSKNKNLQIKCDKEGCNHVFEDRSSLSRHLRNKHNDFELPPIPEKHISCIECKMTFARKTGLIKHKTEDRCKKIVCPYCKKYETMKHQEICQTIIERKQGGKECVYCGKYFNKKINHHEIRCSKNNTKTQDNTLEKANEDNEDKSPGCQEYIYSEPVTISIEYREEDLSDKSEAKTISEMQSNKCTRDMIEISHETPKSIELNQFVFSEYEVKSEIERNKQLTERRTRMEAGLSEIISTHAELSLDLTRGVESAGMGDCASESILSNIKGRADLFKSIIEDHKINEREDTEIYSEWRKKAVQLLLEQVDTDIGYHPLYFPTTNVTDNGGIMKEIPIPQEEEKRKMWLREIKAVQEEGQYDFSLYDLMLSAIGGFLGLRILYINTDNPYTTPFEITSP